MEPLEIPLDECVERIIVAHRAYMEAFRTLELKRFYHGLNVSSFHALRLVAERTWPPSVIFVAERLNLHHSHASALLRTLEAQGFVSSERDISDGRHRLYRATPKGISLTQAFEQDVRNRAWDLISYWPPWKQAEVTDLFDRLVRALRATT